MHVRTVERYMRCGVWLALTGLLVWAQPAAAQVVFEPPAPEEPSSNLVSPSSVDEGTIPLRQSLPQALRLGFYLSINERPVRGDWEVSGEVVSVDADRLVLQTDNNEQAVLLYRLPDGEILRVEPGQRVTILRSVFPVEVNFGWIVDITSPETGVIASGGRIFGDEPQSADFAAAQVRISQTGERVGVLAESDFDTVHAIEVELDAGSVLNLVVGQAVSVTVGNQTLDVELLNSIEVETNPQFEGVAEGVNFTLEFAATQAVEN